MIDKRCTLEASEVPMQIFKDQVPFMILHLRILYKMSHCNQVPLKMYICYISKDTPIIYVQRHLPHIFVLKDFFFFLIKGSFYHNIDSSMFKMGL